MADISWRWKFFHKFRFSKYKCKLGNTRDLSSILLFIFMIERIFYTKNDAIQEYSIPAKDKLPKKSRFSEKSRLQNSPKEVLEKIQIQKFRKNRNIWILENSLKKMTPKFQKNSEKNWIFKLLKNLFWAPKILEKKIWEKNPDSRKKRILECKSGFLNKLSKKVLNSYV